MEANAPPITLADLDEFAMAYLECALWSSTDPDTNGEPLDSKGWTLEDLAPDAIAQAHADCKSFRERVGATLDSADDEQAGHDFWLTRNGHGAGFWDGDWSEPTASVLTDLAHSFGTIDLYPGDDGLLYFS